jgi:hypothetical protein
LARIYRSGFFGSVLDGSDYNASFRLTARHAAKVILLPDLVRITPLCQRFADIVSR